MINQENFVNEAALSSLKTLSERLAYILKALNISQSDVARGIQVKPQIIQYLLSSNAEKSRYVEPIANFLGIQLPWLAFGIGTPFNNEPLPKQPISVHQVPLLEWDEIKVFLQDKGSLNSNLQRNWLQTDEKTSLSCFALKIQDKSMYPRFDQNTIIIINPLREAKHKDFVIAYISSSEDIVFRQYIVENESVILYPTNASLYKAVALGEQDEIWGVMQEARWTT